MSVAEMNIDVVRASVLVHALDLQSFILRARVLTLYRQALKIAQRAPPHARDSCSCILMGRCWFA